MTALVSIELKTGEPTALPSTKTIHGLRSRFAPEYLAAPVFRRDGHACRYCGFQAFKHQQVAVRCPNPKGIDDFLTACIFCWLCSNLDALKTHRSGLLIWAPEISQIELNSAARELYVERASRNKQSRQRADTLLQQLKDRREPLREKFGEEDDTSVDTSCIRKLDPTEAPNELSVGLRVLPLDRLILSEQGMEYNWFPQILSYWRSISESTNPTHVTPGIDLVEQRISAFLEA